MNPPALTEGIEKIISEFKLPTEFPKRVLTEAEALPAGIPAEELKKRVDLRQETIVTIDGETARDFDDAVSVIRLTEDATLLKVSIADVSYYVKPGGAIDLEAQERTTSTYFPDRVIPMLPEKLSNHLCSLVPHEDRLTFTAEMTFDKEGRRIASRFYRSVIRSAERLTYTKVRKILVDRDPETLTTYQLVVPALELMGELADKIQKVRQERGSLDFDLPEPVLQMDLEEGRIESIMKAERNKAHRLIEEFMIAANEAVAEFLTGDSCQSGVEGATRAPAMIYRIHEDPDPEKVKDFSLLLHNLGYALRLGKKPTPEALSAIIDAVKGKKEERLINTVLLRTMRRAIYDTNNVGHFGLASKCYTHFTSPIRRYPDLLVHRILERKLAKGEGEKRRPSTSLVYSQSWLSKMAKHCSDQERVSMKAEWASRDLAAAIFMKDKVGEIHEGIIAHVTKFGFFVELFSYFLEGLVGVRSLKDDYYIYHEKSHLWMGRRKKKKYQMGMAAKIRVRGVNLDKRWIDFEILDS